MNTFTSSVSIVWVYILLIVCAAKIVFMTSLVITSFNCKNAKTSVDELRSLCDKSDIVFLQETWLARDEITLLKICMQISMLMVYPLFVLMNLLLGILDVALRSFDGKKIEFASSECLYAI